MLELLTRAEAYGGAATRIARGISINSPSEISPASSIKIELALRKHTPATDFVRASHLQRAGEGCLDGATTAQATPADRDGGVIVIELKLSCTLHACSPNFLVDGRRECQLALCYIDACSVASGNERPADHGRGDCGEKGTTRQGTAARKHTGFKPSTTHPLNRVSPSPSNPMLPLLTNPSPPISFDSLEEKRRAEPREMLSLAPAPVLWSGLQKLSARSQSAGIVDTCRSIWWRCQSHSTRHLNKLTQ